MRCDDSISEIIKLLTLAILDSKKKEREIKGGLSPCVSNLALCDNHDDFDSQPISKKEKVPKDLTTPNPPPHLSPSFQPASPAMQDSGSRRVNSPRVTIQPHHC